MKTASDTILLNLNNGNYDVALLLIDQLEQDSELPKEVQVYKVECLYALQRFLEAHELASKYWEAGNNSKDLLFMRGIICFSLQQYDTAIPIFNEDPQWSIWKQKAYTLSQITKGQTQPIMFHENIPPFDKKDLKYNWSQNDTQVIVSLNIPDILPNQMKVSFHIRAIDLTISYGPKKKESYSIELEKNIIPRSCSFECFPDRIELTLTKETEKEDWTFQPNQTENPQNITLDSVLMELDMINDVDNNTAISEFQKIIDKLDYVYSSDDEYEENESNQT